MLDTRKSSKSMMPEPGPRGWMPESTLKPSTQGTDNRMMDTRFTATAFFRLHLHRSMEQARMFSNTAITVEMAAKDMNRKNRVPQILPPAICLKMLGKVMKIREGPASG